MIDDAKGMPAGLAGQGAAPGGGPMGAATSPATTPLGAARASGEAISRAAIEAELDALKLRLADKACADDSDATAAMTLGMVAAGVDAARAALRALPPQSADLRGDIPDPRAYASAMKEVAASEGAKANSYRLQRNEWKARAEKAEADLAGCNIALEQAWAGNRKRDVAMSRAERRLETLADDMAAGRCEGGLLAARHLKRAIPGIFVDAPATPAPVSGGVDQGGAKKLIEDAHHLLAIFAEGAFTTHNELLDWLDRSDARDAALRTPPPAWADGEGGEG